MRAHVYAYRFLTSLFEVLTSRVNVIRKWEARPVMIGVMVSSAYVGFVREKVIQ